MIANMKLSIKNEWSKVSKMNDKDWIDYVYNKKQKIQ